MNMLKLCPVLLLALTLIAPPTSAQSPSFHAEPGAGLSLREIIELSADHAPDVVTGRAQLNASRSSLVGARLAPVHNPYLELMAEPAVGTRTGQLAITGTLHLPLEVTGQRARRAREARAYVALHEATLAETRALVRGAAIRVYGSVVVARERARLLEDIVETSRAEAQAFEARASAGDVTLRDAKLALVEFSRNELLLRRTRTDLDRARRELELSVGRSIPDAEMLTTPDPPAPRRERPSTERAPTVATSRAEAELHARSKDRWSAEAKGPLSLILMGGRDDLGQARLGGGLAYAFPAFRANQGEQARADADHDRALVELGVKRQVIESRTAALSAEFFRIAESRQMLESSGIPASHAAVDAAVQMHRAGKGELLTVLVSRRDHAMLRMEHLDLADRQWAILAEIASMTGELP